MGYILKQNNVVISYSDKKLSPEYEWTDEIYEVGIDNNLYPKSYLISAQYLNFAANYENKQRKEGIRLRRAKECFPVINRGALWYEKLTDAQRQELSDWYQAWLDAPQTKAIPNKPTWIK